MASGLQNLNTKERTFCKLYFELGNASESYRRTHPKFKGDVQAAGWLGYRFKEMIITKIGYAAFLEFGGISDAAIANAHKESLESTDPRVRMTAVRVGYQARDRLTEKQDVRITGDRPFWTDALRVEEAEQKLTGKQHETGDSDETDDAE
jgi:hypothetical protein